MDIRPGVEAGNLSDIGCEREQNEDSWIYWEPQSDEQFLQKGRLAIVADGMGGYEGGQQASEIAVKTVREVYQETANPDLQSALLEALRTAHRRIQEFADLHPTFFGMGTTCTAASLSGGRLYFAHVGDSRLYLVRGQAISRLTRDHSYVARLLETGLIHPEEMQTHPQRHVLTAALGVGELTADTPNQPIPLQDGDVLLLCTDGLWTVVSDEELLQVSTRETPSRACRELVQLARQRGAPDNLTVQILRLHSNGAGRL